MAQRMKDYVKLVGWIHLVSNLMAFTEFGGIQLFSNYVLLKPLVDSGLPSDVSDVCKAVENQNTTECQHYKVWVDQFMYMQNLDLDLCILLILSWEVLAHSANIQEQKSQIGLIISIFTFMYGAFSDIIGKKTMMQFYMLVTFVRNSLENKLLPNAILC